MVLRYYFSPSGLANTKNCDKFSHKADALGALTGIANMCKLTCPCAERFHSI